MKPYSWFVFVPRRLFFVVCRLSLLFFVVPTGHVLHAWGSETGLPEGGLSKQVGNGGAPRTAPNPLSIPKMAPRGGTLTLVGAGTGKGRGREGIGHVAHDPGSIWRRCEGKRNVPLNCAPFHLLYFARNICSLVPYLRPPCGISFVHVTT